MNCRRFMLDPNRQKRAIVTVQGDLLEGPGCGGAGRLRRQSASTSIAGITLRCREQPQRAMKRLTHRSNSHPYSITSSAMASSDAGTGVVHKAQS